MSISPDKKKVFGIIAIMLGTGLGLAAVELAARLEGSYARHLSAIERRNEVRRIGLEAPEPVIAERIMEIVVMGDSFSTPRAVGRAWPEALQQMLNDRYGSDAVRFAVRNQSRSGATLTHPNPKRIKPKNRSRAGHFEMLAAMLEVPDREVDLALHQLFINDFVASQYRIASGIPDYDTSAAYVVEDLPFHAWFYVKRFFANYPLLKSSYIGWLKRFESADLAHWRLVAQDYLKIVDLAARHDVILVTFLLPAQLWRDGEYPLRALHGAARATLEPHAPHYLDLLPSLESRIASAYDHWLYPDLPDAHPDAHTHGVYAELLLQYLERSGVLDELIAKKTGRLSR